MAHAASHSGSFARQSHAPPACLASSAEEVVHEPDAPPKRERAEALSHEMVQLTAHISAAEARFLEMLAEFDRDELWIWFGCHCAAQWLTWQCGMGDVAAREHVRVARALEKLPKISAAFRRGEISYSKVREMTRIAIPEMEDSLLNVARHGTAAHMQRLVRKYRRVERLEAAAEAAEQYRRRYVRYRHEDDGMVVIEARLPVEIGEVVLKAIDAGVEVLYQDGLKKKRAESEVPAGTEECDTGHANAGGSGSAAGAGDEGSCAGATPDVLESETDVPAGTEVAPDRCALLTIDGRDSVREKRRTFAQSWAEEVQEWMKAQTDLLDEPRGDEEGSCCASEAAHDAPAARPWEPHETPGGDAVIEEFEGETWQASLGARRADALRLLAESFLASGAGRVDTSADRYQVVVHIDQTLLAAGTAAALRRRGDRLGSGLPLFHTCELDEGSALAIETARRLACDSALVGLVEGENGDPLNVGRKTRAISPALARALRARDGGCRFPGCCRTRFTQAHHIIPWANGGETKLENLVTLCTFHHRLVHEGGFSVRRTDDGGFEFFAPTGERLPETGRLDRETIDALTDAAGRGCVTLHEQNRDRGLEIDEMTARCLWTGERMDYHMAVGGLIWTRDRAPV